MKTQPNWVYHNSITVILLQTGVRLVDNGSKVVAGLFSEDSRLRLEDWAVGVVYTRSPSHAFLPFCGLS